MVKSSRQSGRSMVEMLGVLAIIGVLSVGGIAGYTKAMEMYHSIVERQQMNHLLSSVLLLRPHLDMRQNQTSLATSLSALDGIPSGLYIKGDRIYDERGNSFYASYGYSTYNASHDGSLQSTTTFRFQLQLAENQPSNIKQNINTCINLIQVAASHYEDIRMVSMLDTVSSSSYREIYYGKEFCGRKSVLCLTQARPTDIYQNCKQCMDLSKCIIELHLRY